jgi:hypothetical protein
LHSICLEKRYGAGSSHLSEPNAYEVVKILELLIYVFGNFAPLQTLVSNGMLVEVSVSL